MKSRIFGSVIFFLGLLICSLGYAKIDGEDESGSQCHQDLSNDPSKRMKSSSYQRFRQVLDVIEKDAAPFPGIAARVENFIKQDTRRSAFRIQALLKIFREHEDVGGDFKKAFKKIKAFEDHLGRLTDSRSLYRRVSDLNLPAPILSAAGDELNTHEDALFHFLEDEWPLGTEADWKKKYRKRFDQVNGSKERKFLIRSLISYTENVIETPYDFTKLQEGVHEYRRDIRWILLMLQASGGFFQLRDDPVRARKYEEYLKDSGVPESSFAQIPNLYAESNPCLISKPLFQMVTLAVFKIGDAKDWGEVQENLERLYLAADYSTDVAHRESNRIARAQEGWIEPLPEASKWKTIVDREKILPQLVEELENCYSAQ